MTPNDFRCFQLCNNSAINKVLMKEPHTPHRHVYLRAHLQRLT